MISPIRMRPIDLLIFDLDGTLIDSREDIATAVNLTLGEIGLPLKSLEEVTSYIGGGIRQLLEQAIHSNADRPIEEVIPIFRRHYLDHLLDKTTLYPDVLETLNRFQDRPMAVATNKPIEYTTPILHGLGISGYFRMALGGNSTPHRKPHPEMIRETLKALGGDPRRTLMIGDGVNDILAAKAAGTLSCAVTYGFTEPSLLLRENPDHVCDTLGGLAGICD